MRPIERTQTPQSDLFRLKLVNLIDVRHELCRLAERIDWQGLVDQFGPLYAEHGRPGVPIRLMAGLHYLKHAFGLSDEVVVMSFTQVTPRCRRRRSPSRLMGTCITRAECGWCAWRGSLASSCARALFARASKPYSCNSATRRLGRCAVRGVS